MKVITTSEAINSVFTSIKYIAILENLNLLTELSHFGIVLPEAVVCADTVDTFKNRFDEFWQEQEILYNWKADICTETPGVEVKSVLF